MISFQSLYDEHKNMVYNLCLNYLLQAEDAEEATQDVFVKVFDKLKEFRSESNIKTWIYRITINHCLDVLRKRKRKNSVFSFFTKTTPDKVEFNHPGIVLENREALESLMKTIHTLPNQQITVVLLKYIEDHSIKEIAEILESSEKAVESLLSRARKNLKNKIDVKAKD
ncbi:MAG: RNA polymerase sigma factor [Flavobacteriales bacterium]